MMRLVRLDRFVLVLLLCTAPLGLLELQTNAAFDPFATNKFYCAQGKWTKASNTNCLIWNSFPRPDESVTWSGAVVDGKASGKGVVQWFTNGIATSTYTGEMKAGLADGHGVANNGGYATEGEFKSGSLVSKIITIHYPKGGSYKGEQKDGFKEGQGEEVMEGGVKYVGRFERDRFDGAGEMTWPNGSKLSGEWKDSELTGIGTYTQADGKSFKVKRTEKGIEPVQ